MFGIQHTSSIVIVINSVHQAKKIAEHMRIRTLNSFLECYRAWEAL